MIERILDVKRKEADERARARALVRARAVDYPWVEQAADCECGSTGKVRLSHQTRTAEEWWARCEGCGLDEVVKFARGTVAAR